MSDSILDNVKKLNGVDPSYTQYDADFIIYINGVFSTLHQLGVGPVLGFEISDNTATWSSFLTNLPDPTKYNSVKTLMVLSVKMLFDPPPTSFAIDAIQKQIEELKWRLNVVHEEETWVDPNTIDLSSDDDLIIEGGSA